jgi:hypothetical protein
LSLMMANKSVQSQSANAYFYRLRSATEPDCLPA